MSRLPQKSATVIKASKGPFQPDESEALTLSAKLAAFRIEEAANESKKGKEKVVFKDAVTDAPEGEEATHDDDDDDNHVAVEDGSGPSGVSHLLNDEDDGLIAYDSDEEVEDASKGVIASRSRYPITLLIPEEFLPEVPRTQATIKGLVGIWKDELSDGAQATTTYQQLSSVFLYKNYYGRMQVTFDKASDANFVWRNQVEHKCKNGTYVAFDWQYPEDPAFARQKATNPAVIELYFKDVPAEISPAMLHEMLMAPLKKKKKSVFKEGLCFHRAVNSVTGLAMDRVKGLVIAHEGDLYRWKHYIENPLNKEEVLLIHYPSLKCSLCGDTTKIILKDPSLVLISTSGNREEWVCLQDSCDKAHGSSFEQAAHHALSQRHRHGAPKGGESLRLLKGKINLKHLKKDYGA
ncbi:unnamed protein product [Closterium sp. NIES-64]|nr:unnamed protein product [Closterium sp. NIES-64]